MPSAHQQPRLKFVGAIVLCVGFAGSSVWADDPPQSSGGPIGKAIRQVLQQHGGEVRTGVWVGGMTGPPRYASNAAVSLPTASAIKTAILIELFAQFAADLDQPVPGLAGLLIDSYPTVVHFTPEQRDEIRAGLAGVSVRRLGGIMMGSVPASNLVYNAAASVSIAMLGGPEGTTRAIHARDPAFESIQVRRYMLADRTKPGDNVATTEALAAVLQRLANRQVPGLDATTVEAIRSTVEAVDDPGRGRRHFKTGSLESDPIILVRSGWVDPPTGNPVVFVVMLAEANPGRRSRDQANQDLAEVGDRLMAILLDQIPK